MKPHATISSWKEFLYIAEFSYAFDRENSHFEFGLIFQSQSRHFLENKTMIRSHNQGRTLSYVVISLSGALDH